MDHAGLDALMLLRFFKLGMKFFLLCSIFGIIVLIPINSSGDEETDNLGKLTMAKISEDDPSLWAHLIFAYIFFGALFYMIYQEYFFVVSKRHEQYLLDSSNISRFTALYTDIPEQYLEEDALRTFLEDTFPDKIHSISFIRQTKDIVKLINQREKSFHKLERFAILTEINGKPQMTKPSILSCQKVVATEFLSEEVEKLNSQIQVKIDEDLPNFPSALVTFKTVATKYRATALPHSSVPFEMQCASAPDPDDIFWPNLEMRSAERHAREMIGSVVLYVMIAFYLIPIAFVSSLTSLTSITSTFPFLKPLLDANPVVQGFLEGFLPSLAFIIFMALLPMILKSMSIAEGMQSFTEIERGVFIKFFQFQLINFFLATIIAGSLLSQLDAFIDEPASIVSLLAESVPSFSTFFINFIMLATFAQWPLQLVRAPALVIGSILQKFSVTEYEKEQASLPPQFAYGSSYPMYLLIFLIGLAYCVIAPLISPFAFMYFFFGYMVIKAQFLYVFDPKTENGGKLYPLALKRVLGGCLVGQITLIGLFALKQAPAQSTLSIPLAVATILFLHHLRRSFEQLEDSALQKDLTQTPGLDDPALTDDLIHEKRFRYNSPGLDAIPLDPKTVTQVDHSSVNVA